MQKTSRPFLTEVIWLVLSLSLTLLLSLFLFGRNFLTGTIDIQFHDTYFIMEPFRFLLPFFLLITFILYFIKAALHSFRRSLVNRILIGAGLALVLSLTWLIQSFPDS